MFIINNTFLEVSLQYEAINTPHTAYKNVFFSLAINELITSMLDVYCTYACAIRQRDGPLRDEKKNIRRTMEEKKNTHPKKIT